MYSDKKMEYAQLEFWENIEEFGGYEISSIGRVRSKARLVNVQNGGTRPIKECYLKYEIDKDGYFRVGIQKKHRYVHRLVAQYFCKGYKNELTVDHIDRNRQNNDYKNLRWMTNQQNAFNGQWKNGSVCKDGSRFRVSYSKDYQSKERQIYPSFSFSKYGGEANAKLEAEKYLNELRKKYPRTISA